MIIFVTLVSIGLELLIYLAINKVIYIFNIHNILETFIIGFITSNIIGAPTLCIVFDKLIWKWQWVYRLINWIPPYNLIPPNLNGEWDVIIQSSYEKRGIITGTAIIKQNRKNINIRMEFPQSKGDTKHIAAIQKDNDIWSILYRYDNTNLVKTKKPKDFTSHHGLSFLEIDTVDKRQIIIKGYYANYDRNTNGNIKLTKK